MSSKELELWKSQFGDDYVKRNVITEEALTARKNLWGGIIGATRDTGFPKSIFEVGAGQGINLQALKEIYQLNNLEVNLSCLEPNTEAIKALKKLNISVCESANLDLGPSGFYDMVFTSGVLIHINPKDQLKAIQNIYRMSKTYIVCIEYFAPELREIKYRGQDSALWVRDYGSLYLDNLPLQVLGYGFCWKRISGLDDLTWFLFKKVH